MAALPLLLQDFNLLVFASFAGRTHQHYRLHMARVGYKDVIAPDTPLEESLLTVVISPFKIRLLKY